MTGLVLTIAHNGYAGAFASCIASQRRYCRRTGMSHVAVTRPWRVAEPALSAWLKIPLMAGALRAGYDWVGFVDSDAAIRSSAPDFRELEGTAGDVHIALGRSGRLNSGVMLARASDASQRFFDDVLASLTQTISAEDRANLKFENGNVIHVARGNAAVAPLDARWNNTYDPSMDDHIRHFTGPLRAEYRRSTREEWVFRQRKKLSGKPSAQPDQRDAAFVGRLEALTLSCQRAYPLLTKAP